MTADDFMKLRRSGDLFPDGVTVWLGNQSPRESDVSIAEGETKRVDVRAFAGIAVFVYAQSYSDALTVLVKRIAVVTGFVLVAVADFGADLGWKVIDGKIVEL